MRLFECVGVLVSRGDVLRELRKHDVRTDAQIAEFDAEVKPEASGDYDAMAVLSWLGY